MSGREVSLAARGLAGAGGGMVGRAMSRGGDVTVVVVGAGQASMKNSRLPSPPVVGLSRQAVTCRPQRPQALRKRASTWP